MSDDSVKRLPSEAPSGPSPREQLPAVLVTTQPDPASPRSSGASSFDPPSLPRGTTLGRYVIVGVLGHGGMGVVYSAYDTQLERKLALKFVRDAHALSSPESTARLLREAQAMARLSHRNVLSIFDVGTYGGSVFLAMEYIEGASLGHWLASRRSWQETLRVVLQTGAGLAAAHAAGVIHRDFKPDNVLLGRDGRVVVSDFGLAREARGLAQDDKGWSPQDQPPSTPDLIDQGAVTPSALAASIVSGSPAPEDSGSEPGSALRFGSPLTVQGSVLGTIGFMAPEQAFGGPISALTDQFSFCVTLYLALYGELPFPVRSLPEYLAALRDKAPTPPPGAKVPAHLRKILLRGLSKAPADRFPSMEALLAALRRDPRRSLRAWSAGAAGALVVAALVGFGARELEQRRHVCDPLPGEWAGVWDDEIRATSRRAFAAADPEGGLATFDHVAPIIDRWVEGWDDMHREACQSSRVKKVQAPDVYALRSDCLARRKLQLAATSRLLQGAEKATVDRSLSLASGLELVSWCADVNALRASAGLPDDPVKRATTLKVRSMLAEVEVKFLAGQSKESLALAADAVAQARTAGDEGTIAEALVNQGDVLIRLGKDASAPLREALLLASGVGEDALAVRAATGLVLTLATPATAAEARTWLDLAKSSLKRLGGNEQLLAGLTNAESFLATNVDQDAVRGLALQEKVLAAYRKLYGTHRKTSAALANVATEHLELGEPELALPYFEEARAMESTIVGPTSPGIGTKTMFLGMAQLELGDFTRGEENVRTGVATLGLHGMQAWRSQAFLVLGWSHLVRGDPAAAIADAEQSRALLQEGQGLPEELAETESILGLALTGSGRAREALPVCKGALATLEAAKAISADKPYGSDVLRCEADALVALGEPASAVPLLERDLTLPKRVFPADLARAEFAMARALDAARRDPARALELAARAREEFLRRPPFAFEMREIDSWLADHGGVREGR